MGENDPKREKMTLSTFGKKPQNGRKPTPKWEKAYPKMGENSVKIFKSRGGVPSPKLPRSRRHCAAHIYFDINENIHGTRYMSSSSVSQKIINSIH